LFCIISLSLTTFIFFPYTTLFRSCGFLILSKLLRSPSLTAPFHQKHMEVRGKSLGAKLPHHQRDLTPVISGMVRQMLRQVRQTRSEEHTSELQSRFDLVCRLLLEK